MLGIRAGERKLEYFDFLGSRTFWEEGCKEGTSEGKGGVA